MPAPRTITLHRTGNIKVRVAGPNHCGAESAVVDGAVPVRYTVVLTLGPGGLDDRGFMVDQERLHNFMADTASEPTPWHEPCEQLAVIWGYRLLTWVSVENTGCVIQALDLTLSPAPNAGQFTVHFEQQLPLTATRAMPALRSVN